MLRAGTWPSIFGWRDQGLFTPEVILVDDFTVGGLLNPDLTTLVPEPTSMLAFAAIRGWA